MNLDGLSLIRLKEDHKFKPFDCGDGDLNEFLNKDCLNFQKELLSVTYILESHEKTVAFFSISNDKISIKDMGGNPNEWKEFRSMFHKRKHIKSYPAMKIGRLGVNVDYKGQKIGTEILNYLKALFVTNNRTGCKFITVDAYAQSLVFYEKNKFKYLTKSDEGKDTRIMFYDLQPISKSSEQLASN